MSAVTLRASAPVLVVCALLAGACGTSELRMSESDLSKNDPFVRVSRGALSTSSFGADGGVGGLTSGNEDTFYVAIHRSQLGQRWFLSAYLTQWHPSENTPVRSLGTRVVTFKVQNGALFVFDATRGKTWSDVLDPSVIIEAYPLVTNNAEFNALPGASNYVLFDPSAGLNRFDVVGDDFAAQYWARFQVDLTFLQGFKTLADGVSWEQVFTGYTEVPGPGILAYEQPFRGSGTLRMTLRRYAEGAGFTPTEFTQPAMKPYFWSSNWQYVKNEPRYRGYAVKWNIKAGMQPIDWRISKSLEALERDPQLAGIDVRGAITRGVEGWNQAFGFPVFRVVPTGAADSFGDDDKNFIVVDNNPGAGLAFANWRENPNTGEIRGASVYFSSVFIEAALREDGGLEVDAGVMPVDAGSSADAGVVVDPGTPCSPAVVISQVFGGNSATGAYNQDFVELHNRTDQPLPLGGYSLQYGAASSTSTWQVLQLAGSIPPNGYFLVGLSATSDGGVALPAVDLRGGLSLAAASGKVALVSGSTALTGACPVGAVDFVAYGTTNCAEGGAATPALSNTTSARRGADGCSDSDNNLQDFSVGAPAPRSSASPGVACVCTAPASPLGPSVSSPAGGTALLPMGKGAVVAPRLAWEPMTPGDTCAFAHDAVATIPQGMTKKEYVEKVITHTILHEVGHTLGLRHNFKGSLQASSVMDYTRDDAAALMPGVGAFDIAAVRYLYGLDAAPPSQPFCTDEDTLTDAECDRWDTGATPLTTDLGPAFTAKVRQNLSETRGLTYADIHAITRYVRAPKNEAQRLEAFNVLMGEVAPPLRADVIALGPNATAWADLLAGAFLQNLFVDQAAWRDPVAVNPALYDPAFHARVVEVTKNILVNSDKQRTFERRRVAVDVLKAMQSYDAYNALVTARASLVSERATYSALGQAVMDDLIRRLDLACSPYFY